MGGCSGWQDTSLSSPSAKRPRAIYAVAARTPLVRLDPLGRGAPEVFLKLEIFQPIGSFKIRGAMNAVARAVAGRAGRRRLDGERRQRRAGRRARRARGRAPARPSSSWTARPPPSSPPSSGWAPSIVNAPFDECWRTVETHQSTRMTGRFVHPFDDDAFISGNGTAGLEILEDLPDVDAVVAPMGGGGLLAGIGCVLKALRPSAKAVRGRARNRGAALRLAQGRSRDRASRAGAGRGWTARAASPCCRRCSSCCSRSSPASIVVSLRRRRARDAAGGRPVPRDRRGRGRAAPSPPRDRPSSPPRVTRRSWRSCRAAISI